MNIEDFYANYASFSIVSSYDNWKVEQIAIEIVKENSGGCLNFRESYWKNPQIRLEVKEDTPIVFYLQQHE